jgi:hypothetical protein
MMAVLSIDSRNVVTTITITGVSPTMVAAVEICGGGVGAGREWRPLRRAPGALEFRTYTAPGSET